MKLLAFSDLHGNKDAFEKIIKKSRECDLIVCAGDISIFSNDLKKIIEKFRRAKKQLMIIPGNHETTEGLNKIKEDFLILLHKKIYRMGHIVFVGYGTDGFSQRDKEFERFIEQAKKEIKKEDRVILITHGPPYGTKLDKLPYFGHVGNRSYTKAILNIKPFLAISGHLHENFNKKDKKGSTFLLNPGPEGKLINI